jgi:hypothetical protein
VHPAAFEPQCSARHLSFLIVCLGLCLKIVFLKPDCVFVTEVAEELGRTASSSSVVPYLPRLPLLPSKTRTLRKQGENKENLDGGLDAAESLASSSAPGRRGQQKRNPPKNQGLGPALPVWACLSSPIQSVTSSVFLVPGSQVVAQMGDDIHIF